MVSNKFVTGVLESVRELDDGCEVTMRALVKNKEFLLRVTASDGINSINADLYGTEARAMYEAMFEVIDNA